MRLRSAGAVVRAVRDQRLHGPCQRNCRPGVRQWDSGPTGAGPLKATPGPHGFTEMLYAYSSAAGNNGSHFAGLTANSPL